MSIPSMMNRVQNITPKVGFTKTIIRTRIKSSRLPPQYKASLKDKVYAKPKPLTIRQYLALQEGKWTPYPQIKKKYKRKVHAMNPFIKISEEDTKAIIDYMMESKQKKTFKFDEQ